MAEQEVVITKKKSKEQLWNEILEKAREALEKNAEIKKKLIQKTAEVLEEKGMPLYQICGAMTKELKELASGRYIRECLGDKYKNPIMKREQEEEIHEEIAAVTSANDNNNVTEHEHTVTSDATLVEQVQQTVDTVDEPIEQVSTAPIQEDDGEKVTEQEERFQIRPEDYDINDLYKYSSEFKDQIIIHLDQEITRLKRVLDEMKGT